MDYGAITLDTSIFVQKGLSLESGLLKTLEQFRDKPYPFILSEIVIREVQDRLIKKTSEVRSQVSKAIQASRAHLSIDEILIHEAEKLLIPSDGDNSVVEQRIKLYKENTGLQIVPVNGYVDLDLIVEKYFGSFPPFSELRNKKNEFPDALALISIEAWAQEKGIKVLAVSIDRDWEEFARESGCIDVFDDLAEAIAVFQPHNAAIEYYGRLSKEFSKRQSDIISEIERYLMLQVPELEIYPVATSPYFLAPDKIDIIYSSFEFLLDENNLALVQPVEAQENYIVVEVKIAINATATCSFSLMAYDSISIGETTAFERIEFDTAILISIEGDFLNEPEHARVDSIELLSYPKQIDFGEIEPDWWHEN